MSSGHSLTPAPVSQAIPEAMERHYSAEEIAEAWNLSRDTVRRIFEREPGVLIVENRPLYGKRRYRTFRIPASVVERVHRRMLAKPPAPVEKHGGGKPS